MEIGVWSSGFGIRGLRKRLKRSSELNEWSDGAKEIPPDRFSRSDG